MRAHVNDGLIDLVNMYKMYVEKKKRRKLISIEKCRPRTQLNATLWPLAWPPQCT